MTRHGRRAARGNATALLLAALTLAQAMAAGGCAPLPQIVVLEDPLSAEEHVTLGVAYERGGELEPASREYERALRKDRSSFRARLNLGNVRLAEKRYGDAREEYLEALELRPADPEATNNLAWAAILSGDAREEALERLDAVLAGREAQSPTADGLTPVLLDTRGVLLGSLGRRAEAEAALVQAEAACVAARSATAPARSSDVPDAPVPAETCPASVLREIRAHREEIGLPSR